MSNDEKIVHPKKEIIISYSPSCHSKTWNTKEVNVIVCLF